MASDPSDTLSRLTGRLARLRWRTRFETRRVSARVLREAHALVAHTLSPLAPLASSSEPHRIALVLPATADEAMLGDALNRVAFVCGAADPDATAHLELRVHVPDALRNVAPRAPQAQPDYLDRLPASCELVGLDDSLAAADRVVLWRVSSLLRATVLRALDRVLVLDPTFFRGTEFSSAQRLQRDTVDVGARDDHDALVARNFERMVATHRAPIAYAVGTGPSLRDLEPTGNHPVVGCNSLVLYDEFMERLSPAIVCFADELVFAANPRGHELRVAAERAAARHDTFVVVPRHAVGCMLRHHPGLASNLVSIDPQPVDWQVPTPSAPFVRATWNVMTMHVLPTACAVADTVRIAGCDGRDPSAVAPSEPDWGHAAKERATPLDVTRRMHLAAYRDLDYDSRIADHYVQLDEALTAWEALGRRFELVTHSFVPALRRRRVESQPDGSPESA